MFQDLFDGVDARCPGLGRSAGRPGSGVTLDRDDWGGEDDRPLPRASSPLCGDDWHRLGDPLPGQSRRTYQRVDEFWDD
jgi:hypothetical protein